MNTDLLRTLQEIIIDTVQANSPSGVYDGTYMGNGRVRLEPQLEVTATVPQSIEGLSAGDSVLVIRYQQEKKYAIIARL